MPLRSRIAAQFDRDMERCIRLATAAAACAVLALPAARAADTDAAQYDACMKRAREVPADARSRATQWRDQGGGAPARHCLAVALFNLGQNEEAANLFEALAQDSETPAADLRAELYAQAGQAWVQAGRWERAWKAQSAAVDLRPKDPDLLVDRALTLGSAGKYWEAIDDLNRAIDLAKDNVDALVLRASAYRRVNSLDLAAEDVERALALQPKHVDGLLERGMIRKAQGDLARARQDWIAVLQTRPESPAAEVARANLEQVDLKPR